MLQVCTLKHSKHIYNLCLRAASFAAAGLAASGQRLQNDLLWPRPCWLHRSACYTTYPATADGCEPWPGLQTKTFLTSGTCLSFQIWRNMVQCLCGQLDNVISTSAGCARVITCSSRLTFFMQERNSYLDRVLCITFGAPPSTLSHGDAIKWESSGDQSSCHFWNFLLAHDRLIQTPHLLDVMPAVMCTIPSAMDATTNWLDCVNDVLDATTSGGRNIAREMQHALQGLLTAGRLFLASC